MIVLQVLLVFQVTIEAELAPQIEAFYPMLFKVGNDQRNHFASGSRTISYPDENSYFSVAKALQYNSPPREHVNTYSLLEIALSRTTINPPLPMIDSELPHRK